MKKISTPSEVREIWEEELLGIRDLGGLCVLTMHPQGDRAPSRLRFLDRFMGMVQELDDDVWVAGCADIADTVTTSSPRRTSSGRISRRASTVGVRSRIPVWFDGQPSSKSTIAPSWTLVEHAPHDPLDLPLAPVDRVDVPQDAREAHLGADDLHPLGVLAIRRPDEHRRPARRLRDHLLGPGQLFAQRGLLEPAAVRVRVVWFPSSCPAATMRRSSGSSPGILSPSTKNVPTPPCSAIRIGDHLGVRGRAVVEGER